MPVPVGDEQKDDPSTLGLFAALRQVPSIFDPQGLSARLLIANSELWNQDDRIASEAEYRLSLCAPTLLLRIGVAKESGLALAIIPSLLLSYGLLASGDGRAREANRILVLSLMNGVVEDDVLRRKP